MTGKNDAGERQNRSLFSKMKYEACILGVMLAQLAVMPLDFSRDPYASLLALDYGLGFAPRLLPGSVLSLFSRFRGRREVNIFTGVLLAVAMLSAVYLAGRLIRAARGEDRRAMLFLIALFLAGPCTNAIFFPTPLFTPDRIMALFAMLSYGVVRGRARWLVPVFLLAALASHHAFAFEYLPGIGVLLLYELFESEKKLRAATFTAVTVAAAGAATVWFYLFQGFQGVSLEALTDYARRRTDIPLRMDFFEGYFIANPGCLLEGALDTGNGYSRLFIEARVTVLMLPLIALFLYVWGSALKNSASRGQKAVFALCLALPLARLPLLIFVTELYRSRVPVFVTWFFLLFWFLRYENPAVAAAVRKLWGFFAANIFLAYAAVAYFAVLFASFELNETVAGLFRAMVWPR